MAALGAETFLRHRWIVGALLAVPREGKGHASGRRRGLASRNAPHVCHVAATAAPSSRRPPGGLVVVVVSSGTGSNGSARSLAVAQPGGAAGTRRRKGGVWSGEGYLRQRRGVGVTGRSGTTLLMVGGGELMHRTCVGGQAAAAAAAAEAAALPLPPSASAPALKEVSPRRHNSLGSCFGHHHHP
ncbi:unnamed protein product [Lampetra fluviatilis]